MFWHQTGYKYRPPPIMDKSKSENTPAFLAHMCEQIGIYQEPLLLINLVEFYGREAPLGEAFLDHAIDMNKDSAVYVAFDFHDHCRGLRFDKVQILLDGVAPILKEMKFSWLDKTGMLVCKQNGVPRVNCVDCLDRTNVVQTAIARTVLEGQLLKVGILSPDDPLPSNLLKILQHAWADNGDKISHQVQTSKCE